MIELINRTSKGHIPNGVATPRAYFCPGCCRFLINNILYDKQTRFLINNPFKFQFLGQINLFVSDHTCIISEREWKTKMSSFSLDYNPYMALSQAFSSRNVTTHLPNVKKATDLIARENSKLKWAHSLLIVLYYYYDKKGTDLRKVSASSVETSDRYEVKTKKTLNSWWASPVIFWGKRFFFISLEKFSS